MPKSRPADFKVTHYPKAFLIDKPASLAYSYTVWFTSGTVTGITIRTITCASGTMLHS